MHNNFKYTNLQLQNLLQEAQDREYDAESIERLQWFLDYSEHGNVQRTCKKFNIARTTFYRWMERFDPSNLETLCNYPGRYNCYHHTNTQPSEPTTQYSETKDQESLWKLIQMVLLHPQMKYIILMSLIMGNLLLFVMGGFSLYETYKIQANLQATSSEDHVGTQTL